MGNRGGYQSNQQPGGDHSNQARANLQAAVTTSPISKCVEIECLPKNWEEGVEKRNKASKLHCRKAT